MMCPDIEKWRLEKRSGFQIDEEWKMGSSRQLPRFGEQRTKVAKIDASFCGNNLGRWKAPVKE
jgi:hypothetical protein